jgi:hypothetical protein
LQQRYFPPRIILLGNLQKSSPRQMGHPGLAVPQAPAFFVSLFLAIRTDAKSDRVAEVIS